MDKEALLKREREQEKRQVLGSDITWDSFVRESRRMGWIAGPLVAANLSQYFLQIISIMIVGHLDELSLSSTAVAISLSGVSGFSLLYGMSTAMETLCGQAFGAQRYDQLGVQTYTAIFSLNLLCIPISFIWMNMEKLLIFMGQEPQISHGAAKFTLFFIPALFAYGTLQALVRFFQTQSLTFPLVLSSCATLLFHIPVCWLLVFYFGLGHIGAALAIGMSYWLNVILLGLYMMFSPICQETRVPISMEMFREIRVFFRFAIPSAFMICLEWWSCELLTLLSGLVPNPELETSVLSVCMATVSTVYMIAEGIGAAASTRVSNELGAGNPQAARTSVYAAMTITVAEGLIVSIMLYVGRHVFGHAFSNVKEVVQYVTSMAPLLCFSVILDSLHGVLSGVARGCGWQDLGAYVNLGAYYVVGIPIAVVLGFWVHLRGKGLWIGILSGAFMQTVLLSAITICTDWEKQAKNARDRIFAARNHSEDRLLQVS